MVSFWGLLACPEFIVIGHYTIDLLESSVHGLLQPHSNVPVCLFDLKKIIWAKKTGNYAYNHNYNKILKSDWLSSAWYQPL